MLTFGEYPFNTNRNLNKAKRITYCLRFTVAEICRAVQKIII